MSLPKSVEEIISQHVAFEVESIDRMYCNLYMDGVQTEHGTARFFLHHRKEPCATAYFMEKMTRAFLDKIDNFAKEHNLDVITFAKHSRKEDIAKHYLAKYPHREGVLFIGKAQEKCNIF